MKTISFVRRREGKRDDDFLYIADSLACNEREVRFLGEEKTSFKREKKEESKQVRKKGIREKKVRRE